PTESTVLVHDASANSDAVAVTMPGRNPSMARSVGDVGANARREHAVRVPLQEHLGVLPGEILATELREGIDAHHLRLDLQPAAREAAVVRVQLFEDATGIAVR